MRKMMMAGALALCTTSLSIPATAQIQVPSGLVNVTVGNVILEDILTDVEINALNDLDVLNNNQIQVQVPIGVAANVCGISAAVIGKSTSNPVCTAESGSQALAQAIRKQHLRNR
jgi:cobalamin biosynthesis protein CbiD